MPDASLHPTAPRASRGRQISSSKFWFDGRTHLPTGVWNSPPHSLHRRNFSPCCPMRCAGCRRANLLSGRADTCRASGVPLINYAIYSHAHTERGWLEVVSGSRCAGWRQKYHFHRAHYQPGIIKYLGSRGASGAQLWWQKLCGSGGMIYRLYSIR